MQKIQECIKKAKNWGNFLFKIEFLDLFGFTLHFKQLNAIILLLFREFLP